MQSGTNTLGPPRKLARHGVKTGDGPPHLHTKMCKARRDPERGVGGLRVQPLSGALLKTRGLLGSVVLQAAGLPPRASSVLKRIRTPWALGARRLGPKKKDGVSVLVGGGVSALRPPFLKVDSDNTWTCMEEKLPRLLHALREGFLLPKNPPLPLGCPRVPPFPIKGGPRQPKKSTRAWTIGSDNRPE